MCYQLNSLVSVYLCQLQCTIGKHMLHTGFDELVTLSWLSSGALGCEGLVIWALSLGL